MRPEPGSEKRSTDGALCPDHNGPKSWAGDSLGIARQYEGDGTHGPPLDPGPVRSPRGPSTTSVRPEARGPLASISPLAKRSSKQVACPARSWASGRQAWIPVGPSSEEHRPDHRRAGVDGLSSPLQAASTAAIGRMTAPPAEQLCDPITAKPPLLLSPAAIRRPLPSIAAPFRRRWRRAYAWVCDQLPLC